MAEAPTLAPEAPTPAPPAPAETSAPVEATAPVVLTSMADLDARMTAIRAADTAEKLHPTIEATPAPAPAAEVPSVQEAPVPVAPIESPAKPEQPAESVQEDAPEPGETGDVKPGGRMAKLRDQLLAAETKTRETEARLQERQAADAVVRQRYAKVLGTPEEKAQLDATIADPNTTYESLQTARTRLAQIKQATEELAPIYTAIQADVFRQFTDGLNALRDMPGMDAEQHQKLFTAATGPEALKIMHAVGAASAREAFADEKAQLSGEIASLKQANQDLKTRLAASAAQPVAGGGKASGTTGLAAYLGSDGFPTEEAIELAKHGGLRTLGVSQ